MDQSGDATSEQLLEVVYTVASERDTGTVLRRVVEAGRALTGARYAAIGVPDGDGGFATFLTSGVSDQQWDAIGELPRQHGLLGALLTDPAPVRLADIRDDPRFSGWPAAHPAMRSFLGVPVSAGGEILAELFLADKHEGTFTDADVRLVRTLAAHTALAIANAQRLERNRELSIAGERARLARDLHDSVTQTLFSLSLAAETAAQTGGSDQLDRVRELTAQSLAEMRSLVETLRSPDLHRDGLAATLRSWVELLRRVHDVGIELVTSGRDRPRHRAIEPELMAVATEALSNALQHASATSVRVVLDLADPVRLSVTDDGAGFDPSSATRGLGLTSMRERTQAIGGTCTIESSSTGTSVTAEVPDA